MVKGLNCYYVGSTILGYRLVMPRINKITLNAKGINLKGNKPNLKMVKTNNNFGYGKMKRITYSK